MHSKRIMNRVGLIAATSALVTGIAGVAGTGVASAAAISGSAGADGSCNVNYTVGTTRGSANIANGGTFAFLDENGNTVTLKCSNGTVTVEKSISRAGGIGVIGLPGNGGAISEEAGAR